MGSAFSLSRKSKSSKRLHSSKDNRSFSSKIAASKSSSIASFSTSSALPSDSNVSISGLSDVSTAQLISSTSTDSFGASTCQEQINLSLKSGSSNSVSTVSLLSDSNVSTALLPTTKCFFDASTCQRQNFAFPAPIMEYIAMHPSSAKVYQKLIQTCKYFFARNPILVFPALLNWRCHEAWHDESFSLYCTCPWPDHRDGWKISYLRKKQELFGPGDLLLKDVPKNIKIWPTERMILYDAAPQISSNALSSIIPRFYRCDITMLCIYGPELSLDEVKLLATNVEELQCIWPSINNENGCDLSLKDIIAVFPKLKQLFCHIRRVTVFSPEDVMELVDIPELQEFVEYHFARNPDAFDINEFYEFMIENKNIEYKLYFHPFIPQTLKDQIDACKNRLANEVYENGQKRPKIIVKKWKQNENEVEAN